MSEMRDHELVRLYWPVALRPAFDALFAIDDAMAEVVATASQAALGAIKLAWWREALGRLDHAPPPPEPRLQAAAGELLPRGVTGADLAQLEQGWTTLLDEEVDPAAVAARGALLFGLGARLLGVSHPALAEAGALFAVVDAARRQGQAEWLEQTPAVAARFPARLRPLTVLAALAARDRHRKSREPEATPGRAWTILRHRIDGIICSN